MIRFIRYATLFALSFILACNTSPGNPFPGCVGESSQTSDGNFCNCRNEGGSQDDIIRADSLQCEKCEPRASRGAYCDCGNNSVIAFKGQVEQDLRSNAGFNFNAPATVCASPENNCPSGQFTSSNGTCQLCIRSANGGPGDSCGVCGPCRSGLTCFSGTCLDIVACRVTSTVFINLSGCGFESGDQCAFNLRLPFAGPGDSCNCTDSQGCAYNGQIENLSM